MAGGSAPRRDKSRIAKDALAFLGFLLSVLAVWEGLVRYFEIEAYLLPSVFEVWHELINRFGLLMQNAIVTINETVAGLMIGTVLGILIGVAIVYVRFIRTGVYPLIIGFQSVPKVAVAPLLVIWFGYGILSKIAMSFLISFFPMVVATIAGLTSVPYRLVEYLKSMNGTEWQIFLKVRVPNSLPHLMDGFKVSLPLAVIGAIVGEFAASEVGLGALIMLSSSQQDTALIFATLLVVSVISMALFGLIVLLERLIWWRAVS